MDEKVKLDIMLAAQHLVLVGPTGYGKTTLLLKLVNHLAAQENNTLIVAGVRGEGVNLDVPIYDKHIATSTVKGIFAERQSLYEQTEKQSFITLYGQPEFPNKHMVTFAEQLYWESEREKVRQSFTKIYLVIDEYDREPSQETTDLIKSTEYISLAYHYNIHFILAMQSPHGINLPIPFFVVWRATKPFNFECTTSANWRQAQQGEIK